MVDFTSDPRLQPDPRIEALRDRIYGSTQLPRTVRRIEQEAEDAEAERNRNEKIMRQVREYVCRLLLETIRKHGKVVPAQAQKPRTPVVQKGEPGTQIVKIAGKSIRLHDIFWQLRRDGYSARDAATICGHYI
jgi:hypothetical protein